MLRQVSSSRVSCVPPPFPPPISLHCSQDMLNRSRPVLLGGGRAKNGSSSICFNSVGSTSPDAAHAPLSSYDLPVCCAHHASISRLPGPQSKPEVAGMRRGGGAAGAGVGRGLHLRAG